MVAETTAQTETRKNGLVVTLKKWVLGDYRQWPWKLYIMGDFVLAAACHFPVMLYNDVTNSKQK